MARRTLVQRARARLRRGAPHDADAHPLRLGRGRPAFDRLTEVFYGRVREDDVLAGVFAHMPEDHPRHVATWLAEVFGGPPEYTERHGGYGHMVRKHRGSRSPRSSAAAG